MESFAFLNKKYIHNISAFPDRPGTVEPGDCLCPGFGPSSLETDSLSGSAYYSSHTCYSVTVTNKMLFFLRDRWLPILPSRIGAVVVKIPESFVFRGGSLTKCNFSVFIIFGNARTEYI